jgi:type II secretory ATPase GspE/PulE/Tfp pilus assembly ATPase PilB-like protein
MPAELVSLAQYDPLPSGAEQYTLDFIKRWSALKLSEDPANVLVGATNSEQPELQARLARYHRKSVRIVAVDATEFAAYLGRAFSGQTREAKKANSEDERITLDRLANDAPVVNLVNSLLMDAVRLGASDIHIEAFTDEVKVRYRIDGILKTQATFEASRFQAIASRIKIMANLNIMERRLPQDGRITVTVGGESVDMRVSIVPIARGESIVLRIFGASDKPLGLEELGFDSERVATIRSFYRIPHGLVLATGPTGSGKTTTLNAMLREIRSDKLKIITIEDPVEYIVEGIAQIQTNEQIHLGFDTILRRVLRQDPNVIMIGEIRDSQTAELAVRAALTGHLVLSTLHTNDSVSAITRLKNMGVEAYLIASTLRGVVAQRLVRKLCPDCSKSRAPTTAEKVLYERFKVPLENLKEPVGCKRCGGTGFHGRLALGEVFAMDEELEELVLSSGRTSSLRSYLIEKGMTVLAVDGLTKAAAGFTTLGEVEREVGL